MRVPAQCTLWERPELIRDGSVRERFERLEIYEDESHLWRYLLKCRECGQLYFFEFYEQIDWQDGDDPQFTKYIPVETADQIEELKKSTPIELFRFRPQLQTNFPKGARAPEIIWVR